MVPRAFGLAPMVGTDLGDLEVGHHDAPVSPGCGCGAPGTPPFSVAR